MLPKTAWILNNCQGKSAWPVSFSQIADSVKYVREDSVEATDVSSLEKEITKLKKENSKLRSENKKLLSENKELDTDLQPDESQLDLGFGESE